MAAAAATPVTGEVTIFGDSWDALEWIDAGLAGSTWTGSSWTATGWIGHVWL